METEAFDNLGHLLEATSYKKGLTFANFIKMDEHTPGPCQVLVEVHANEGAETDASFTF